MPFGQRSIISNLYVISARLCIYHRRNEFPADHPSVKKVPERNANFAWLHHRMPSGRVADGKKWRGRDSDAVPLPAKETCNSPIRVPQLTESLVIKLIPYYRVSNMQLVYSMPSIPLFSLRPNSIRVVRPYRVGRWVNEVGFSGFSGSLDFQDLFEENIIWSYRK